MSTIVLRVRIGEDGMPFFAEAPYFLWGEVNYDSEGNCRRPTDRSWTELELTNRRTGEQVSVWRDPLEPTGVGFEIEGDDHSARLLAYLIAERTGGRILHPESGAELEPDLFAQSLGDLAGRRSAADHIRAMFLDPALAPFDSHAWWGGWKWVGEFSTDFAAGSRMTMLCVQQGRADPDVVAWLRDLWRTAPRSLRPAVRYALQVLTGVDPESA
jgi:hypothetical protein